MNGPHATPIHEIEPLLRTLDAHKREWARLDVDKRLRLLDQARADFWALREEWVQAELDAKGIPPLSFGLTEEWVLLAQILRAIGKLSSSLADIRQQGRPRLPGPIAPGLDGQVAVRVFPQTPWDRLMFLGVRGEVWMEPGIAAAEVIERQAARYRDPTYPGAVALVLGAGNASMIPVCDALHKLYVDLQVVVLKLHPANAHLGPLIERGLRAFIERGFLRIAYGGAEMGAHLANHPLVEELHLTGSDKTYQAVVFGSGADGRLRKAAREPLNSKPFTGELGSVSPVIVVPGPWTQADVEEQAKHIATWLVVNAGFACLTPRVIVQHEGWTQRESLSEALRQELARCPTRVAYYPGAFEVHGEFLATHPEAHQIGSANGGQLPWTIVPDVDPRNVQDICFTREAFCALCAETSIRAETVEAYLERAVEFANDTLWGTLCATLIVHPASLRDPATARAIERAIARLRYGTVSVNLLAFYGTYFGITPWGAPPGHDCYDIQSGIGKCFNALMLDRSEKTVLRAPFKRFDPMTVRSPRAYRFARKLAAFEASPSWWRLTELMWAALRS